MSNYKHLFKMFVIFHYICPTYAQYVNSYLFLTALLHVSMFTHHPQGVCSKFGKQECRCILLPHVGRLYNVSSHFKHSKHNI